MKELEKMLANLLRPKIDSTSNQTVERLEVVTDTIAVTEVVSIGTSSPESRVGFATIGYSEVS